MRRSLTVLTCLALLAFLLWQVGRVIPTAPRSPAPSAAVSENPAIDIRPSAIPERSSLADALNSPATDIHSDLRVLSIILDTFRTNFPRSGNPVGNNAEITAALTGHNPLRFSLIPPDHPAIDRAGELRDRWGTPFFFHAESATEMSIRSAGPDRRHWTNDDILLSP